MSAKGAAGANDAAARYLEHRPRTEKEIEDHLAEKGFEAKDIAETIKELKEFKYLDDVKYAEMYLRYAIGKGHGIKKILFELGKKGVGSDDINDGIAKFEEENEVDISDVMVKTAEREAEKIPADPKHPTEKEIAKIGRRLTYLGHDEALVYSTVGKYMELRNSGHDEF